MVQNAELFSGFCTCFRPNLVQKAERRFVAPARREILKPRATSNRRVALRSKLEGRSERLHKLVVLCNCVKSCRIERSLFYRMVTNGIYA